MDRTAFAECAVMVTSLVLAAGCGAKTDPPRRDPAPRVLAELQQSSPGAWRHAQQPPREIEAVDSGSASYPPPAELFSTVSAAPEPPATASAAASDKERAPRDTRAPSRFDEPQADHSTTRPPCAQPARELPLQQRPSRAANQPEAPSQRRTLIEYRAPQQHEVPVTPEIPQTPDQRGTLPWAYANRHSPEMNSALKAAGDHVRNGFNLAQRNALYLARAEFIAALELVAEANDVQQNTRFYTDALNAGLLALAESSDFVQRRPVGRRLDIARIVSGHKTPILKTPPHNRLAPTLAAERYNSYAREQLAAASAMQSDASMALLGLGKVAIAQGTTNPAQRLESTVKATTLYQAALMADSGNFGAANELGVIQARRGELAQARDLLVHSVQLAPHPATHRNLAAVYEKLGQTQLAEQAKSQAVDLEQAGYRRSGPAVQWLDPAAFANTAPATDSLLPPATGPTTLPGAETPPRADEKAATTAKRGLTDWLPWTIRR